MVKGRKMNVGVSQSLSWQWICASTSDPRMWNMAVAPAPPKNVDFSWQDVESLEVALHTFGGQHLSLGYWQW